MRDEQTMENPHVYTHERPTMVERKMVEDEKNGTRIEVRIQPNVRKAIK